ncbi:geranylgeranyl reductase family protein [Maritimibacter sp. DP1N21-5]|uniref:geranylgeranyl reductase family protein n=1 Tax=Maritimibacter sp. DP1N21-5 TaxID=2836867 RepID=UPI001C463FAF|nr:geranylgeranyl reductase family protein [Maritimibacter sp. DP1N21-5]MBV7408683.1 geranylgeranyl reductase family protein [Maritimibacter sp. DP1N21-5]
MSDDFDVIVMGAGPAGSAAAKRAADLGLTVALIDRSVFPRHKLCGALVSPRAHTAIADVHGTKLPDDMYLASRKVAFKWNGETLREIEAPYDLTYTMRTDFDHWLQRSALRAGAVNMEGTRVAEILDKENALLLEDGRRLTYGVFIGADGAASPVAKHLFGQAFDNDKIAFAFETEVDDPCAPDALMSIDFRIVRWGYGWNFPKRATRTIGLGGIKSVDQDLKTLMNRYLVNEGVDPTSVKIKGAHLPGGDYKVKPGRGNVLLAGDAAGFVDAITGEGIALAIESGALAAEAAAEAIRAGHPARADRTYFAKVKPIQSELDKVRRIRGIVYAEAFETHFKSRLTESQWVASSFFDVLAGKTTYAEVEKRFAQKAFASAIKGITAWPAKLRRRA